MRRCTLIAIAVLELSAVLLGIKRARANDPAIASLPVNADGMAGPPRVDFATQIQPILTARCMPCHFQGGVMHERLPFDQPATIKTLGEKLFTRIKNEEERRVIGEFLRQM